VDYGSDVHRFLVYYTGREPAEDLVQETFLRALNHIGGFEGRCSPRTWLISIARRVAIDEERKRKRRSLLPWRTYGGPGEHERSTEQVWFERQEQAEAYRCAMAMKRSYRDVLALRLLEGLSASETAEALGWSESRVHVTLHRALKKARLLYEDTEGGGRNGE